MCEAILQMQEIGMYHRDLKPSNILLGNDLNYKVIDAGVASLLDLKKIKQ